jgi:hypothetical protein
MERSTEVDDAMGVSQDEEIRFLRARSALLDEAVAALRLCRPRLALLDEAVKALRFYANAWDQRPTDRVYHPDAQLLLDAGGRGRKFLARIEALEKAAGEGQ